MIDLFDFLQNCLPTVFGKRCYRPIITVLWQSTIATIPFQNRPVQSKSLEADTFITDKFITHHS